VLSLRCVFFSQCDASILILELAINSATFEGRGVARSSPLTVIVSHAACRFRRPCRRRAARVAVPRFRSSSPSWFSPRVVRPTWLPAGWPTTTTANRYTTTWWMTDRSPTTFESPRRCRLLPGRSGNFTTNCHAIFTTCALSSSHALAPTNHHQQ